MGVEEGLDVVEEVGELLSEVRIVALRVLGLQCVRDGWGALGQVRKVIKRRMMRAAVLVG